MWFCSLSILMFLALLDVGHSKRTAVRPRDDPQACPWDVKICVDGTWTYRDPERQCEFADCWVKIRSPTSSSSSFASNPSDAPATSPPPSSSVPSYQKEFHSDASSAVADTVQDSWWRH